MATALVTQNYRNYSSKALIAAINAIKETQYVYFFYGVHVPTSNLAIQDIPETIHDTNVYPYRNMIAGKKVNPADVNLVIKNYPYVAGQTWTMYSDDDPYLKDSQFFTVVNEGAYYHCYKVLDNNQNAISTIQPSFSDIQGSNTVLYQTSDGYRWKYMYTVSATTASKFSTNEFFPLSSNSQVISSAVAGALDVIEVEDGGSGYNNYLYSSFTSSDIKINGNNVLYQLSTSTAPNANGYYTGCLLYLADGVGAGQYSRIVDYFNNNNGRFVVIQNPFTIVPTNGTTYQITPEIVIQGDGGQTANAVSRALINAVSSNSIYRAEILTRGAGYSFFSASAVANSIVNIKKAATLQTIYSPAKGHGFDPSIELYSNSVMISVTLAGSESNTIPIDNQYSQIGFIKNPQYANVVVHLSNPQGTLLSNEVISKITKSKYYTNAVMTVGNSTITCSNADFTNSFSIGQTLFLSNTSASQLVTVNAIINSTTLIMSNNSILNSSNIVIYTANIVANATISGVTTQNTISLTNCVPNFSSNDFIIGLSSGSTANVNYTTINGIDKGFSTFVQMNKYKGVIKSGTMIPNEVVYQGNISSSNASLFSVSNVNGETIIYTSNQVGSFSTTKDIVGATSGAIITITAKYNGELLFGSGDTLYLENITPYSRSSNTESYKFVFNF